MGWQVLIVMQYFNHYQPDKEHRKMKLLINLPAPVADIVQQSRGELSIQRYIVEAIKAYHQQTAPKGRGNEVHKDTVSTD